MTFEKEILELGFECSEKGFNDMKRFALDYCRQVRVGKNSNENIRRIYAIYIQMIILEADTDFLEGKYSDYHQVLQTCTHT